RSMEVRVEAGGCASWRASGPMPISMRSWSELSWSWLVSERVWRWKSSKKSGWAAAHKTLEQPGPDRAYGVNVSSVCERLGMTRQNYYARRKERRRRAVDGELVAQLVQRQRQLQPRLGTRKLYHLLKPELKWIGVRIGRDRMFEELRKRDLLLEPMPAPSPHTTQSYHNLPVFRNVIKDKELKAPNEVWVSDLSYLRTLEGFLYLALIT